MNKQIVRTRIAPSPTGEDLHIGSVYMALFNYVFAKQHEGRFIIRIEDTDRERYVKGAEKRMLDSLNWVGIPHDEGVDLGGQFAPYRQSERLAIYKKYALELVEKKHAYYCFCSSERLIHLREEQQKKKLPPMYDGLCKLIPLQKAEERVQKEQYVIRLNIPDSGETVFTDLIHGEIRFKNQLLDDQVLLKSDGFPTYHLAVVVDDHLMEISHVIRGEEWISSTPKHILLYSMFGWFIPMYAHLPLLRNPDKSKLSKRKNPVWLSWFRQKGFLNKAITNYLGTLTWSIKDGKNLFGLPEMIKQMKLSDIKTTAPIFDLEKLKWLNGEYIRKMTEQELFEELDKFLPPNIDRNLVKRLLLLAQVRMKTLDEFYHYLKPFLAYLPVKFTRQEIEIISKFTSVYKDIENWTTVNLERISKQLVKEEEWSLGKALMIVRLSTTGEKIGLPLFETLEILGKKVVIDRLEYYEKNSG